MGKNQYQIVFMTAGNLGEAKKIADALVRERLAACVNIVDRVVSLYRWKGEFVEDNEVLLLAKIRRADFDALRERVTQIHSYEVPEVIGVDLSTISAGYAGFLREVLDR